MLLYIVQVDFDGICRSFFLFVHYLCVDLSGAHIGVTEHLAHRIDVRSVGKLQGGERMAETVEGDVLGDTR